MPAVPAGVGKSRVMVGAAGAEAAVGVASEVGVGVGVLVSLQAASSRLRLIRVPTASNRIRFLFKTGKAPLCLVRIALIWAVHYTKRQRTVQENPYVAVALCTWLG
jgi:hypothetical protein